MPVPRRLLEAWERHVPSQVQMEGGVTPREEGGWQFEDARERQPRARAPPALAKRPEVAKGRGGPVSETVQQRVKPPTQAQNIAEIRQLLGERFDEIGRMMTSLERFISASAAGGSVAGDTAILGDPLGALQKRGSRRRLERPQACWEWLLVRSIPRPHCAMDVPCWAGAPGRAALLLGEERTRGHCARLLPSLGVRRLDCLSRGGRRQFAPRGPSSNRSTGSNCRPQPPFSGEGALLGRLVDILENRSGRGESRAE